MSGCETCEQHGKADCPVHGDTVELRSGSLFTGTAALDMAAAEVFGVTPAWFADLDLDAHDERVLSAFTDKLNELAARGRRTREGDDPNAVAYIVKAVNDYLARMTEWDKVVGG